MRRLVSLAVLAAVTGALWSAPAAQAATPVQIGVGDYPVITVGPDGVGHAAWELRPDSKDIAYCRLPPGATSCTPQILSGPTLAAGGAGGLNIFAPTANKIVIIASGLGCGGGTNWGITQFVSTNGGTSFTPTCRMSAAGIVVPTRGKNFLDQSAGNDRFFAGGGAASGRYFLATPNSPTLITENQQDANHTIFSTGNFYDVAIGAGGSGANSFLVAASYSQDSLKPGVVYSVANVPPFSSASSVLNNQANWTKDISLPGGEKTIDPPNIVSGPSGTFIVYQDENEILNDRIGVAKFEPNFSNLGASRFASPTLVDGAASDSSQSLSDAAEDQGGRIHLVWNSALTVRYARSDDGGATFKTLGTILTDAAPITRDIAAGPDGRGWMIYTGAGTSYTMNLIPLEPTADPPPSSGGTTPPPAATPVTTTKPAVRRITATVPGASITFGVPKGCVQPGSTFKVTLSWKRKKKKGNKFVKVTRADFYIGRKVVRKDKKAPFVQTLKVTASARRGSTIELRARAFIKVRKGKAPKKSIKAKIKVCP